jgi:hypothetical protein
MHAVRLVTLKSSRYSQLLVGSTWMASRIIVGSERRGAGSEAPAGTGSAIAYTLP